ncbi:hypothetical protein ACIBBG_33525 [Micromonospora chersina]|uniref:hypothetical protein n=1 Tax=Micromonospora chersina TaxID=47854 RepID=UPI0037936C69
MTLQTWAAAGIVLGVILTSLTLAGLIGKPLRKLARQNDEFREDWYGQPARPGRDAVPGVPERLARMEKELHPNGGGTLRDAINRVEQRLEDHLRSHSGI